MYWFIEECDLQLSLQSSLEKLWKTLQLSSYKKLIPDSSLTEFYSWYSFNPVNYIRLIGRLRNFEFNVWHLRWDVAGTLVARFSRIRVLRRKGLWRRVYIGFSRIRTSSCQCGGKVSRRAPSFGFRFSRRGFLKCKFKVASTDGANFTASGSVWHLAVILYMHITSRTKNFQVLMFRINYAALFYSPPIHQLCDLTMSSFIRFFRFSCARFLAFLPKAILLVC